jgi:hypothetical protein
MFASIGIALALAVLLFLGYILMQAYYPTLFRKSRPVMVVEGAAKEPAREPVKESFQATPPESVRQLPQAPPKPAPAPLQTQDAPEEPRVVAPGGPGAPNAAAPADRPATLSPDVNPLDPYSDSNMEAPIHDSMRHPELSFGPGVDNSGFNKLGLSGVGSAKVSAGESPFSPDFAQNGASFMGEIFANDLSKGDQYAMA